MIWAGLALVYGAAVYLIERNNPQLAALLIGFGPWVVVVFVCLVLKRNKEGN